MPEIELRGNSMDSIWILALMHFPHDEQLRQQYYARKFAESELEGTVLTDFIEIEAEVLENILGNTQESAFHEVVAKRARDAFIAGSVLTTLYGMYSFPNYFDEPSLKKAIFVAGKFAEANKYRDGSKISQGKTAIRKCFDDFRGVAHLWAALQLHREFPKREQVEILGSLEAIDDFLGIARTLQEFGCSFIPKRTSNPTPFRAPDPILDSAKIWKVPSSITPLPPPWTAPPEWILEARRSYRAPVNKF